MSSATFALPGSAGPRTLVGGGDENRTPNGKDTNVMTHLAAARATRTRTGGPSDGPGRLEHVLGWALVVVLAMLVTQLGLI
ncbi:SCO1431 family membrane protein [Streptomyces sp. M19]